LTPTNFNLFNLDDTPATLTVAAAISKHRKTDLLPLHPDLVTMLGEWTRGLGSSDPLFPKLAKRRTWLMVQKDLERIGIPYLTEAGIADFHAAGRRTQVTELLRSGASLAEARQLARHSDINMTLKYTHIGLQDQARALAGLPNPCQRIVSVSRVLGRPSWDMSVIERRKVDAGAHDVTECPLSSSDNHQQKETPPVKGGVSWRRRESNPRPVVLQRALLRV
jgi:integrase/recombinase XerD